MKFQTIGRWAAAVACVGMMMPTAAWSADTRQAPGAGLDVALGEGGLFVGQIVTAQGTPQAHTEVDLLYQGKSVVRTVTDERGVFAARGLRGGAYEVMAADCVAPCRLWSANAAPPAARRAALIVASPDVVNGQYAGNGGILNWMRAHPLIVAGAVVTAIAVPVAIAADDDDPAS